MKTVYTGSNYIELQILKGLLEQHGLDVEGRGESLQGAAGELPVNDLLRLQVADQDQTRALEIIAAYERGDFTLEE